LVSRNFIFQDLTPEFTGLDAISGIGPKKRKILLKHFKGVTHLKKASIDDVAALPGINKVLAQIILNTLNKG
jgi:excinuclease ABC subunit C